MMRCPRRLPRRRGLPASAKVGRTGWNPRISTRNGSLSSSTTARPTPSPAATRDPAKLDKAVQDSLTAIQTWDAQKCERQKPLVAKHFGEGTPQSAKVMSALDARIKELQAIGYAS